MANNERRARKEARREEINDAYLNGFNDGKIESLHSVSAYGDDTERRDAYNTGYKDGQRAERDRVAYRIAEELEAQAREKHEEKIDQFLGKLMALVINPPDQHNVFHKQYGEVKSLLLDLIPWQAP